MGTIQGLQNEWDSYHISDSCVTRGRAGVRNMQSRFFSEFGRMSHLGNIGALPGYNSRSRIR